MIADHAELVSDLLHHHHEVEDKFTWPLLLQRAPAAAAGTASMEDQHAKAPRSRPSCRPA